MRQGTELLLRYSGMLPLYKVFHRAAQAWLRFWFEPADPLMLGIIRLLGGWMLFYNLLVWTTDLEAFFGDNGLQPLNAVRNIYGTRPVFSFWLWTGDKWLWPMHFACLTVAAMFCLGLASRVTSVLAFLITISYSQRVPIANFGFDQILGLLCLYLSTGPCGASVSLDSLIRRWWRKRRGIEEPGPRKFASARMSMRLFQLHLCAIYFWAGFAKLKGPSWWTGEAMWNVIANQEYQTIDLTWMAWVPWLPFLIAHVTIAWEVFFIAIVWNRTLRPFVLAMGVGMHVGIGAFLGMWTFGLIMAFAYLAFSDPDVWRSRLNRWTRRGQPTESSPDTGEHCTIVDTIASEHAIQEPIEQDHASRETTSLPAEFLADSTFSSLPKNLCVISAVPSERAAMRKYLKDRSVPCRLVADLQSGMEVIRRFDVGGVVVNCAQLSLSEVHSFVEDVADLASIPILVMLPEQFESLRADLQRVSGAEVLTLPASLRELRVRLQSMGLVSDSGPTSNAL